MSPEVSIYLQKIKLYFSKNDEIRRRHFFSDVNESNFFDMVEKMSEQNFKEKNEPALSIEQFEEIRQKLQPPMTPFLVIRITENHYGYYSLN